MPLRGERRLISQNTYRRDLVVTQVQTGERLQER